MLGCPLRTPNDAMHTVLSNRMALELEYPIQVCGYVVVVVFFCGSLGLG